MQGLKLTHVSKGVTGREICVYGFLLSQHITSPPAIPGTELIATECYIIYAKRPSLNGEINEHSLQTKGCGNESSQNRDGWLTVRINNIVFI